MGLLQLWLRKVHQRKKEKVAEVATQIFGKEFSIDDIINEYLEPCTSAKEINAFQLVNAIRNGINSNGTEENFKENDLANWLEMNIALKSNHGVLERGIPRNIGNIVELIHRETSLPTDDIKKNLNDLLKWAESINEESRKNGKRQSFLPFRFHQFISQTGSISVTLEPRNIRQIVSSDEPYLKINDNEEKKLYPLLFLVIPGMNFCAWN